MHTTENGIRVQSGRNFQAKHPSGAADRNLTLLFVRRPKKAIALTGRESERTKMGSLHNLTHSVNEVARANFHVLRTF